MNRQQTVLLDFLKVLSSLKLQQKQTESRFILLSSNMLKAKLLLFSYSFYCNTSIRMVPFATARKNVVIGIGNYGLWRFNHEIDGNIPAYLDHAVIHCSTLLLFSH